MPIDIEAAASAAALGAVAGGAPGRAIADASLPREGAAVVNGLLPGSADSAPGGRRPRRVRLLQLRKGRALADVGGILRPYPGKTTAEVHDYHDVLEGVLASSLVKRAAGYLSLGFPDPR